MKKILFILSFLVGITSFSQNWNTTITGTKTTYSYFLGANRVDSGLVLGSTNDLSKTRFKDTIGTLIRYQDSLYFRTTAGWVNLSRASSSTNYVKYSDTALMLLPYLKKGDTMTMLLPYLRKADTIKLSNRINQKLNITDTTNKWLGIGWASIINNKVKYTDTALMLQPYLKFTDTATILATQNYVDNAIALNTIDTTHLSDRINLKLNISDTTNKWVALGSVASGDLTGTYPSPTVHKVHNIDLQAGTPSINDVWVYGGSPNKWQHQQLNTSQLNNNSGYIVAADTVNKWIGVGWINTINGKFTTTDTTNKWLSNNWAAIINSKGTVSSVTKTDGLGIKLSITNTTTTPNITANLDTSNSVVLSRDRAANTYQPIGDYATNTQLAAKLNITDTTNKWLSSNWASTINSKFVLPTLNNGSVLFSNGTTIAQNNAAFNWDNSYNRLGVDTIPVAKLHIGKGGKLPAFGLNGAGLRINSATYTDTTTPNTNTVTWGVANSIGQPTFAYGGGLMAYTNAATLYLAGQPLNGTGVNPIINPYALYINSGTTRSNGGLQIVGGFNQGTSASLTNGANYNGIVYNSTTYHIFNSMGSTGVITLGFSPTIGANSHLYINQNIITPTVSAQVEGMVYKPGTIASTATNSIANLFRVDANYNYTGGATGIVRGFYYSPAITSLAGVKNIAFENATGDVLLGTTSGNVGIGVSTPTAYLHLKAGTATAGTAPIKLTTGTNLATIENGAIEYDGSQYYASANSVRYTICKSINASASLDFPSIATNSSSDLTITVTGAVAGNVVAIGVPNASIIANISFFGWVSAANTVTIRCTNNSFMSAGDPAAGTFKVSVFQ